MLRSHILFSTLVTIALLLAAIGVQGTTAHAASVALCAVQFQGSSASPHVVISGSGLGTAPAASNLANVGYTGFDYANALYFCDDSNNPRTFCAGQNDGSGAWDTIGLLVDTYSTTRIGFGLGSAYDQFYYPTGYFVLNEGDHFSMHVQGALCRGIVHFGGASSPCYALSLTPAVQRCLAPCALAWTLRLTDSLGLPVSNAPVSVRIWFPNPTWAPSGGTGDRTLATRSLTTSTNGTVTTAFTSFKMTGVRIVGEAGVPGSGGVTVRSPIGAAFYLQPAPQTSMGLLLISPGDGHPYGECTATVIRSASDFLYPGLSLPTTSSTLLTAGHCAVATQFWFYPASTTCNFGQTPATTALANSDPRCAPLGIWPARVDVPAGRTEAPSGRCCGAPAEDVGFVQLLPDPLSGATVNEAVQGVPIEFNQPAAGLWLIAGTNGSGLQVCGQRVSVVGSGADAYWTADCPQMVSGDSGGPWLHVAGVGSAIGAVNSKGGGLALR